MSADPSDRLPFVDEHTVDVAADAATAWSALCDTLEHSFTRPVFERYGRLVGVADPSSCGPRPLAAGSALPGFRVVTADPGRGLVLAGHHRFSGYRLTFRLAPTGPGTTRLHAETRATFPGPAGALYRLLVITSGAHALGQRHLLASIRHRAEGRHG
jgi:hypothetical protein